ncbi:MAG TPA: carboxypeptidase-like regulatory domain-containing protein [Pirellulales bacterium]|nr:carboxypeptidase-like regulatory domain-containing protein [Pirellulales bacterium]
MSTRTILPIALGLFVPILGCKGGEKPATVPVTGTVTYKGAALAGAAVSFIPKQDGQRGASGTTDEQGHFKLQTYLGGDTTVGGAVPGDYAVTVSKRENLTEQLRASMGAGTNADGGKILEASQQGGPPQGRGGPPPGMMRGGGIRGKSLIPENYESADKSGLTATVKPSENEPVKIELVDQAPH